MGILKYIWSITHADGGDSEPRYRGGVPPIWSSQEGYFLIDFEFFDEIRDGRIEERTIHAC